MRGVKVLLKYILGILLKGREIVNHSTEMIKPIKIDGKKNRWPNAMLVDGML